MDIKLLIEVFLILVISVCGVANGFGCMKEQERHNATRKELAKAKEEIAELKAYIEKQKVKNIIELANKFYEGKKK